MKTVLKLSLQDLPLPEQVRQAAAWVAAEADFASRLSA